MIGLSRFIPFQARARKAVRGPLTLEEDAEEVITVCLREVSPAPPDFMLEGDRQKVVAAQSESSLEREWKRVAGGPMQHGATRRYLFRNVLATPYGFYTPRAGHNRARAIRLRELLTARIEHREKGYFALPNIGMTYFGHWLRDGLPATLLCRDDEELFLPVYAAWPHTRQYVDALGIDRIEADYVLFDQMSFCVDTAKNDSYRTRFRAIRDRVQARAGRSPARGLYISRAGTGAARVLINEDEVVAMLRDRGFATVSSSDPLGLIWERGAGVSQVVTIEGSHWAHAAFAAAPGALHVTINPADRFNNVFADYMASMQSRLATVVAERDGEGYRVDVASVAAVLDRANSGWV